MIYIKCFEFGDKSVMIVPRKNNMFSVKIQNYRSPHYQGWETQYFKGFRYTQFTGTLSECNDIFNQEVSYLCRVYDDDIYTIADMMAKREDIIF